MANVLLVEDDELIGRSLSRALVAAGHEVRWCTSLLEARRPGPDPDLVLCDLGLPDGDGLDLIGELAGRRPGLPVIALTARAEEADVVAGLATGAVDYLTKPFRLAELLARIDAQLRQAAAARPAEATTLTSGDVSIDLRTRAVRVGGRAVELRPREFDLLARLARDPGAVVTREDIMRDVWDEHWWGSTKTLDVHVRALRSKLDPPGGGSYLTTIRGVGYRLDPRPA